VKESENMSENPKEWNYPGFSEKGKVICQVCGKAYMILTPSHLKTHNLKYSEYKNKFPGAPITTEEFKAISKYSKPSKYTEEDHKLLGEERIIDDIPVIDDEFEMPKIETTKKFSNPIEAKKYGILTFLAEFLPSVKQDHMIVVTTVQNVAIFQTISDFADPVLKIDIEFPDTFWHNQDMISNDPSRNGKLIENGWRVVTVRGNAPTNKDIEKALRAVI
jgi:hypothetical protein